MKSNDKCCKEHKRFEKFCEVSICLNEKQATQPTCGSQLCKDIHCNWQRQRNSVRHKIGQRVVPQGARGRKRTLANFRDASLPRFLQDALVELAEGAVNLNSTEELIALLYSRADNALAAEIGVRHGFGRRFTASMLQSRGFLLCIVVYAYYFGWRDD